MSVPFVGRRRELDALQGLIAGARSRHAAGAALISGEPGSGKSRLLAEALDRTHGAPIVRIVGFEPSQPVPLAASGEFLRRLTAVPEHGRRLESLVFGDAGTATRDPLRVFEAAHRALRASGPMLVAIDDLQWVDDRSQALVGYLLRAAAAARGEFVVLAAARPAVASTAFRALVEAELPADRRVVIELGPLDRADGVALARSIDRRLDDDAATAVWRRAQGSPFWLEALAGRESEEDAATLIEDRLRGLTGDAGALAALLAVAARPFIADDLAEVEGWEPGRTSHAARELVTRGLAVEASGTVRLSHDLIRDALDRALPSAARKRLHASLSRWMEGAAGDDVHLLDEALRHRIAAGLPAAALAIRLVRSAQRRLLGVDTLRSLAAISDSLEPGTPDQVTLDAGLAELAASLGEQELALGGWLRVARRSTDPANRRDAQINAARAAYFLRRADEARGLLATARTSAPLSDEATIRIDALQADIELWLDHRTRDGSRTAGGALEVAERMARAAGGVASLTAAEQSAYLAALVAASDAALQEDRSEDVVRLSGSVVTVARELGDEAYLSALVRAGFAVRPLGRVRESEAHFAAAWDLAKRLVVPTAMIEAGIGLARALRDMGRLREAHAIATETADLEQRLTDAPHRWGNARGVQHTIELSLGDPAAALEAARREALMEQDPHFRLAIHQAIAGWLARVSGPAAAAEVQVRLETARADSELAGCPRCAGELLISSAELEARIGHVLEARRKLEAWDGRGAPRYLMADLWRERAAAAIATAEGDPRAVERLTSLAAAFERAELLEDVLWTRLDLGRALEAVDRTRSVDAYAEAARLADRIGAVSQGRLAAQALRRLGVRAWRRGPASSGAGFMSLSAREQTVARLAADGASNREIAAALLVSPKTVERHLTNILAKLGLRNRTALASLVRSTVVRDSPDE
ncbi:MAG TPA: AAA family ATPase [Candidatus Limnocylindrales bacterium]|nr:AAA family ATPase [Candidatus Limnocylindrales bacterium]